jgi:hypothetical protein
MILLHHSIGRPDGSTIYADDVLDGSFRESSDVPAVK